MEFIPVAGITAICFFVGYAVKQSPIDERWTPCICGLVGGILGPVAMFTMPGFPVNDIINAIAVGIVSGLAATGTHQIYKQLSGD